MENTRGTVSYGERLVLLQRPLQTLNCFGLIRSMAARMSIEGAIAGAPFSVAAELAPGDAFDGRADLYRCSSGTLFHQLTKRWLSFFANHHCALSEHARAEVHGLPQSSPSPHHARPEGTAAKE